MFKKGNLVRLITDDGDGEIMTVLMNNVDSDTVVQCKLANDNSNWFHIEDLELVSESIKKLEKAKNPQPEKEQTIAIVSFEGAVKREVAAIREAMKCCDAISSFELVIKASGAVNSGEVDISYRIGSEYGSKTVTGNNVRECVSEYLRRYGWDETNKPIAISYDGIPT